MPLQAIVQSVEFLDASQAHVVAVVTDGSQKAVVDLVTNSIDTLKERCRQTLDAVSTVQGLKGLIPGQVLDLTPTVIDPDPAEVAKGLFLTSYQRLQSALRKVSAGVIQEDDADLAQLRADTLKLYVPGYLGVG